jgi:hypothetical protein
MTAQTIAKALGAHRTGATWMTRCPVHEDRSPSLAISTGKDDKVLVRCHAGWDQRDLIAALQERGLWQTTGRLVGFAPKPRADRRATRRRGASAKRGGAGDLAGIARGRGNARRHLSAFARALPCRGGVVRLCEPGNVLMVGALETCLAATQASGKPAWAALSTSGLRSLDLPNDVRDVIVLADGDEPGEAAAQHCARRWKRNGRRVRIARPPQGMDFNDLLTPRDLSFREGAR